MSQVGTLQSSNSSSLQSSFFSVSEISFSTTTAWVVQDYMDTWDVPACDLWKHLPTDPPGSPNYIWQPILHPSGHPTREPTSSTPSDFLETHRTKETLISTHLLVLSYSTCPNTCNLYLNKKSEKEAQQPTHAGFLYSGYELYLLDTMDGFN